MSDQQIHQDEEYVLVPRKRLKLSRMRKGVIGAMLVGAVGALAGAGTFASFSATTTNDATFKTVRLAMSNAVNGGSACTSPSAVAGSGTINAAIDTNDASGCAELFPTPLKSGVTATAAVVITNVGDTQSDLFLFAPANCTVGAVSTAFNTGSAAHGTNGPLCGRVDFSLYDGTNCLFPVATSGACTALADGTSNATFSNFFSSYPFATRLQVATAMAATSGTKTFTVTVRMKNTTGCSGDTSPLDGFVDATGVGCDNIYMNEKATLQMRWLMQG